MNKAVATIQKNKTEQIQILLDQYNGRDIFNARVFFEAQDGEMRPGKSGIAFSVAKLPEFADAVQKALAEAKKRGLVK